MATTADFSNGLVLDFKGDLFAIVEFQHVKPGKGGAFVRTKLKSLTTGKVIENTFNSGEKVDTARVERRPHQFLYKDEAGFNFMDNNTFDQISVDERMINAPKLLKEGQNVEVVYHADEEKVLSVELPSFVVLQITYTEPAIKGNTATNAMKKATLETGAEINVPLFIEQDEIIKVDTRDSSYSERVKS